MAGGGEHDAGVSADTLAVSPPGALPSHELPPGTRIDRYLVLRRLGGGGMGVVYMAYDEQLDRRIALKLLVNDARDEHASLGGQRLLREAQAMAKLSHPNVVAVFDVGAFGDQVFLALEYVDGATLRAWRDAKKRASREIVATYAEAGRGLEAAHAEGILHRDFKPENVVVDALGRARVLDFGLARIDVTGAPIDEIGLATTKVSDGRSGDSPPLTLVGALLGTPGYMSPEQIRGERAEARSDQFAFCVSLYEALYGERPYAGETLRDIHDAIVAARVRPSPKGSHVPRHVRSALLRGLRAKPDDRFPTMRELLRALTHDVTSIRLRWVAAAAVLVAACAIPYAMHAAGERRVRACRTMSDRLGGIWDAPRRDAVAAAFRAVHVGYAEESWAKVEHTLDAYASSWSAAMDDACSATRVRGEQSEAMLALRAACLDDRLDELRATVDVLASADDKLVSRAPQTAQALSPIDGCSNLDRLSAAARLPSDPAMRSEIRALQTEIATARALEHSGKRAQSRGRLRGIDDRVRATAYGPLIVHWTRALAASEVYLDATAAVGDLDESVQLADKYHLDPERAEAEIALGRLLGMAFTRYEDGHRWLDLASATLTRFGGDARLEVERDAAAGSVFRREGKSAQAMLVLRRALDRASTGHVDDPVLLAEIRSSYAEVLNRQAHFDDAIAEAERAERGVEDAYGSQSPLVASQLNNVAFTQLTAGHPDAAHASAMRALAIFQGEVDRGEIEANALPFVVAKHTLGEVLLRQGHAAEAVEQLTRAHAAYQSNGAQDDSIALVDNEIAEAWLMLARSADAGRAVDEASAIEAKVSDLPVTLTAATLEVRAEMAIEKRATADAVALAERALAAFQQEGDAETYALARAKLVLAHALELGHGDTARARALAAQAREGFAKLGDRGRMDEATALMDDPLSNAR
jgi:tetratricopeptide (TPR) repeat protein/predicted Ser/Thr protein kinase